MTVTQAAQLLGIHPDSVRQRILAGSIAAVRVGSVWLIEGEEVGRYARESLGKRGKKQSRPTCREQILKACAQLRTELGTDVFELAQIVEAVSQLDNRFSESTIRTHVTSRLCENAPTNHGTVYPDFERVGRGRYRVLSIAI